MEVKINDPSVFIRFDDLVQIADDTLLQYEIPKQLDKSLAEAMDGLGSVVSNFGTGTTFVSFALNFLLQYEMNSILGNVRSLSYITHLMMLDINYPVSS